MALMALIVQFFILFSNIFMIFKVSRLASSHQMFLRIREKQTWKKYFFPSLLLAIHSVVFLILILDNIFSQTSIFGQAQGMTIFGACVASLLLSTYPCIHELTKKNN